MHNGGSWSEARFHSFIKSALRNASLRWPPKNEVKKRAWVKRGVYLCNGCKKEVPATIKKGKKRVPNVFVDHINPVIDPRKGFVTWDEVISRLFCEAEGLQVLCGACHDIKTNKEREIARKNKKNGRVQRS